MFLKKYVNTVSSRNINSINIGTYISIEVPKEAKYHLDLIRPFELFTSLGKTAVKAIDETVIIAV